jgi:hypothetical protein
MPLLTDSPASINPPHVWEAQIRLNNGTYYSIDINAINGLIAKEIAQAQCGGSSNCQVVRITAKRN